MTRFRKSIAGIAALGVFLGAPAFSGQPFDVASAQETLKSQTTSVVRASERPFVGEVVMNENGVVDDAFFARLRTCTDRGCRVSIFDKRSGAVIYANGAWISAYRPTGRGQEVIRVQPFSESENAASAPDDSALETAASVRRVIRVEENKNE